jgi:hypothetical protein
MYEGEIKNNKINGKGKIIYEDGEIYEGEWKNNNAEGRGILKFVNGDIYDGEFKDDVEDGIGMYTYHMKKEIQEWRNGKKIRTTEEIKT